ncbi:MAG: hypothetical protein HY549_12225 [Elusimicrobia bacterium]|nr:hypothetical protein [Elusimicrobiota bacterium]
MSDNPEELSKEIGRLWSKLSSSASSQPELSEFSMPPSGPAGPELAWEAVSLIKRQHKHESRYWSELLEAKEKALRSSQERQALLEQEIRVLRERVRADEEKILSEGLDVQSRLETSFEALKAEREQHQQELRDIKAVLEQYRQRLAAESARWKEEQRQWEKREQQYLLDLHELQATASRHQEDSGRSADESRRLSDSLKEAKNALEKTLAELLRERQIRGDAEKERERALKKVEELEKHFHELSKIWEEERSQWRELWDRERSTWETQRTEFSSWEEKLRKEREAWHAELKAKEQDQLKFAEQMTHVLRESSETSTKVSELARKASVPPLPPAALRRRGRWIAPAALLVAALAMAWPAYRYFSRYHFRPVSARALELNNPTALSADGKLLWASEWSGYVVAINPEDLRVLRSIRVPSVPFRPSALAFSPERLWSADAAGARLLRHDPAEPEKVLGSMAAPGPAPTALAFDGQNLWSFDAANQSLYRHGADEGLFTAVAVDRPLVATAMAWYGKELWAYDSRGRRLLVFLLVSDTLVFQAAYELNEPIIGMAVTGGRERSKRRLWALVGPQARRSGYAIIQYRF